MRVARSPMYVATTLRFFCILRTCVRYEEPSPPPPRRGDARRRVARPKRSGEAADRAVARRLRRAIVQRRGSVGGQVDPLAPLQGAARGGSDPYPRERHPSLRLAPARGPGGPLSGPFAVGPRGLPSRDHALGLAPEIAHCATKAREWGLGPGRLANKPQETC